jgi:hypothetical protein
MERVASDDLEWTDLDEQFVRDRAFWEAGSIEMAVIAGTPRAPYVFRLPLDKLRKKARAV